MNAPPCSAIPWITCNTCDTLGLTECYGKGRVVRSGPRLRALRCHDSNRC